MPGRVDNHQRVVLDPPDKSEPWFALVEAIVDLHQAVRVEEGPGGIDEAEATCRQTGCGLNLVPLKLHRGNVGQRTTTGKAGTGCLA